MLAQTTSIPLAGDHSDVTRRGASAKTGLYFLMAAISSMFFLFLLSYILRSQVSDWEALSEPWQPLAKTWQLWINTALLLVASISIELAKRNIDRPGQSNAREFMWLAGLSSLGFLIGQLVFWRYLMDRGFLATTNPANAFFFLLTGLHALHLVGGMVAWLAASRRVLAIRKEVESKSVPVAKLSIELCASYWHFLLVVWILLFALLSSSPGTYAAIARFCGFGE